MWVPGATDRPLSALGDASRRLRFGGWFAALALTLMMGCETSPEDRVDAFLLAAHARDADTACAYLSRDSRRMMRDMAAYGFTGGNEPCEHLFTVFKPRGIEDIKTVSREGNKAQVAIVDLEGKTTTISMRREDGQWKIELSASPRS